VRAGGCLNQAGVQDLRPAEKRLVLLLELGTGSGATGGGLPGIWHHGEHFQTRASLFTPDLAFHTRPSLCTAKSCSLFTPPSFYLLYTRFCVKRDEGVALQFNVGSGFGLWKWHT
jgi:hypothetical protein